MAVFVKYNQKTFGLYYKNILAIVTMVSDACTVNDLLALALASLASVINYTHK
jgi:hypothetical protein